METNCERNCPTKADCCRYMLIPIGDEESDFTRWVRLHKDIDIVEWRGLICIRLNKKCKMLKNNKCSIYKDRPDVCKTFKCNSNFE